MGRDTDLGFIITKQQGVGGIKRKYVQQKESPAPRTDIRGKPGRTTGKEETGKVHDKY